MGARQLTPKLREQRVDACEEFLRRFEPEGDGILARIVTGDEIWVHFYQPETKRASKEWRLSSSPKPKKFRTEPSAGKVMLTLFWDKKGVILEHYMPRGTTVNSASYSDLLQNHHRPAIKSKRHGLLSSGVLLQHDNARPHTARTTVATITDLHFECFLIHHTHQTLPQAISVCLDCSKKQWEERSSVLMKRYATQCMSGCANYHKNFF